MSFFSKLFDLFKPKIIAANPGVARSSRADLHAAILALNSEDKPWVVTQGGPEKADLVAEWKMTDREWGNVFRDVKMKQTVQILIKFDDAAGEVRSVDLTRTVKSEFGQGGFSYDNKTSRGQSMVMHFGAGGGTEMTNPVTGGVVRYSFVIDEVKKPLQDVITAHGWGWRGLVSGVL